MNWQQAAFSRGMATPTRYKKNPARRKLCREYSEAVFSWEKRGQGRLVAVSGYRQGELAKMASLGGF